MNIIDYALQMEKEGEAYYRELAAEADHLSVKNVFELLADAEAEHYQIFMQMKLNQPVTINDNKHISKIKTMFAEMREKGDQNTKCKDQIDAYMQARDLEKESQAMYEQKAEELTNPEHKQLCLRIAEEERKHYLIMDNMINFLQRPDTWLEDAEWHSMEDY